MSEGQLTLKGELSVRIPIQPIADWPHFADTRAQSKAYTGGACRRWRPSPVLAARLCVLNLAAMPFHSRNRCLCRRCRCLQLSRQCQHVHALRGGCLKLLAQCCLARRLHCCGWRYGGRHGGAWRRSWRRCAQGRPGAATAAAGAAARAPFPGGCWWAPAAGAALPHSPGPPARGRGLWATAGCSWGTRSTAADPGTVAWWVSALTLRIPKHSQGPAGHASDEAILAGPVSALRVAKAPHDERVRHRQKPQHRSWQERFCFLRT
mmetsp:Transcript_113010/g.314490  ORF Transcript_113010/g.314490 Transcript_113010/m.314490 type:complete len:264 (-) Transcript_113010:2305-3096(-)